MSESTNTTATTATTISAREAALERARARARAREQAKAAQEAAKNAENSNVSNCNNATATLANPPAPKKALSPRELALMLLKSKASTTAMCRVYVLYLLEVFKGLENLTTAAYLGERSALTALAIFGGRKDLLGDFQMWCDDFSALYRAAKPEDDATDASETASETASEEDETQFCKDFDEFCQENDFVLPHTEKDALSMCKTFAQAQTPYSDNVFCKNIACGQGKNYASFTTIRDAARAQLANLSPSSRGLTEEEREAIRLTQAAQEVTPKTGTHASVLGSCFGDLK